MEFGFSSYNLIKNESSNEEDKEFKILKTLRNSNPPAYRRAMRLSRIENRRERFYNQKEKAYNIGFFIGVKIARGLEKLSNAA